MTDTGIALAPPARRSRLLTAQRLAVHLATLAFLGMWEAASYFAPPYLLPGPVPVAARLWRFATSAHDLGHLGASLFHVAAAIAISL